MTTPVREYIDVSPSNGTGTASYKDGNPIVNFVIGAQERFLLGSTIRLNGKFTAYNSANHDSTQNLATETPGLAMDPRLGVFAVIDSAQRPPVSRVSYTIVECAELAKYRACTLLLRQLIVQGKEPELTPEHRPDKLNNDGSRISLSQPLCYRQGHPWAGCHKAMECKVGT